jgi:hypothetical protein
MYAAAAKPAGVGGVPQDVAKEFTAADEPGKLPEKKKGTPSSRLYKSKQGVARG